MVWVGGMESEEGGDVMWWGRWVSRVCEECSKRCTSEQKELSYLEQAMGSSQEPGTDWTIIFDSLTPEARSLALVPARRGSMIAMEG